MPISAVQWSDSARIWMGGQACCDSWGRKESDTTERLIWSDIWGAQPIKNPPAMRETGFNPWVGKIPWSWAWQPTPVFLSRESHGQRRLAGYSPWGHKESDMTWVTKHKHIYVYTHTHTDIHTHILFCYSLSQDRAQFLYSMVGPCCLSVVCVIVCIC